MRALGTSIALAAFLLALALFARRSPQPPPREAPSTTPTNGSLDLPSPPEVPSSRPGIDPTRVVPTDDDHAATPETIQVPSQERLHAELTKVLSLDAQQSQRVRDVLDRHAKKMAELLHAERDDAFPDRLARARHTFTEELLSALTAEQQMALKATALWKRMVAPAPVDATPR